MALARSASQRHTNAVSGKLLARAAMLIILGGGALCADSITIIGRVTEGTSVITAVTNPKGMAVQVRDKTSGVVLPLQGGSSSVTSDNSTGAVSIILAEPLYGGQSLEFSSAGQVLSLGTDPNTKALDIRSLGDWGRVRGNFAIGTVLSFDNNFQLYNASGASSSSSGGSSSSSGSQATLFLNFNMEKNWVWAGLDPTSHKLNRHLMLTSFFETRLTSVPVSVCQSSTAGNSPAPTGGALRPAAATAPAAGGTSNSGCSTSDGSGNLSTFLNSAKSAELQGGIYAPILTNLWTYNGAPNSLFVAPVARVGFITPTGSTTGGSTSVQPVNPSNFYSFYAFGARVGHFKMSSDSNAAPELLSYLDVMAGRFSNLETLEATPGGNRFERRWRVAVEGALKVPSTPLILGVSANIGQNLSGPPTLQRAKDDLRFFIGARFDIGRIMAKLPQL